ncbi:MAG: hypothetical protein MZV64_12330 [Ignavibacteriales bacterium]|nr:hypothetical protein [Ignavibacteriales bacterium]
MYARFAEEDKIQKIDDVISGYFGDPVVELALHDKFVYYFNEEKDLNKATVVSNELDKLFPGRKVL